MSPNKTFDRFSCNRSVTLKYGEAKKKHLQTNLFYQHLFKALTDFYKVYNYCSNSTDVDPTNITGVLDLKSSIMSACLLLNGQELWIELDHCKKQHNILALY